MALSHGAVPSAQPVTDGFISPVCVQERGRGHASVRATDFQTWMGENVRERTYEGPA